MKRFCFLLKTKSDLKSTHLHSFIWFFSRFLNIVHNIVSSRFLKSKIFHKESAFFHIHVCIYVHVWTGKITIHFLYLLSGDRQGNPRGFHLLQCNLNSLASTNKIWVWSVYVVHLQIQIQYDIWGQTFYKNKGLKHVNKQLTTTETSSYILALKGQRKNYVEVSTERHIF